MKAYRFHGFLLAFSLINLFQNTAAIYVTRLSNLKCKSFDEEMAVFQECRLRVVRRGLSAATVHIKVLRPITELMVNVAIYKKASGYKPFLYNTTYDLCRWKTGGIQNVLARIANNFIAEFSNINHTCPYEHDLIIQNMTVSEDKFKLMPIPPGEYM
uniref:Uncharacterized protein n=1 Tax=Musca domestica TaxID=7370 RepID=A0A1I8N6F7_MUSDO